MTRPRQAWRRLHLVDVADGSTSEVGPPGENIWEFDWDGRSGCGREGHGFTERAYQLDFWRRARAFFDKHLLR